MGKLDYLDALKRAMSGLPPELQAKTLAYYEQRFIDGVDAGRAEEDVAKELDDPKKIAMTLRANAHLDAFQQKKNPANAIRVAVSAVGLAIFNLFMVVPAMVYAALLAALYASALAFYLVGIAVTASGLSGANELSLAGPLSKLGIVTNLDDEDLQTKMSIGVNGIELFQEKVPEPRHERIVRSAATAAAAAARATAVAAKAEAAARVAGEAAGEAAGRAAVDAIEATIAAAAADAATETAAALDAAAEEEDELQEQQETSRRERVMRRAEAVAGRGIQITTEMDPGSRATQTVVGLGMVVGGIILFLLSLVITKYTLIGAKRYIEMNFSLLKGH